MDTHQCREAWFLSEGEFMEFLEAHGIAWTPYQKNRKHLWDYVEILLEPMIDVGDEIVGVHAKVMPSASTMGKWYLTETDDWGEEVEPSIREEARKLIDILCGGEMIRYPKEITAEDLDHPYARKCRSIRFENELDLMRFMEEHDILWLPYDEEEDDLRRPPELEVRVKFSEDGTPAGITIYVVRYGYHVLEEWDVDDPDARKLIDILCEQ